MPKIYRQRDIDRMKPEDVSQEFVDYYNRLSEERKTALEDNRLDLVLAILDWEERTEQIAKNDIAEETLEGIPPKADVIAPEQSETDEIKPDIFSEISKNVYEGKNLPDLIQDDFRPVEALTIDDHRMKCLAHHILLKEYMPKFHKNGKTLGRQFLYCPKCNRLFIKQSNFSEYHRTLNEWGVPHKFYDYELSREYLAAQIEYYELDEGEKIYVPDVWIEEKPLCPLHKCLLEEMPCERKYKTKSISFNAYYCEQCRKVILRRAAMLNLEDQCAEAGIPIIEYQRLAQTKPTRVVVNQREIKPDYIMNEGKREEYTFDNIAECYKLTEQDTVVVSDSIYCNLDGHETETTLGLIWVTERDKNRRSYLFRLGYCSECEKYYMDEVDYKTIYQLGRPEVTIILDSDSDSYMITSGEVFDLERKHLQTVENTIQSEEDSIRANSDYVNPYETQSGYDDGGLAYSKGISKKKYGTQLETLYDYRQRPYEYRVDICANGETEVYYVGPRDINLKNSHQVISANSDFGRKLVNYQTIKVRKDNREYDIKLSRQFDIDKANLYGYANLRTDEDSIFRKGITDPFLIRVLNMRKKQHNLIDIFVTIQENQNAIVDARFEKNIIVQGCAGSGKTMVLLHRLSSLKYNRTSFNFNENAMILTPNDNFTLHIKGLAESLQIGYVNRSSVEQYYADVLEQYSKEFKRNGKIASEMTVKQAFVDYIYSDEFKIAFQQSYEKVIRSRTTCIERVDRLAKQMGEKVKQIDRSNESKVIPQVKMTLSSLGTKVERKEQRVSETEQELKKRRAEKRNLEITIPQQKREASKKLRTELIPKVRTKVANVIEQMKREISYKEEIEKTIEAEQKRIEGLLSEFVDIKSDAALRKYLKQNHEWQSEKTEKIAASVFDCYKRLSKKTTKKKQIDEILAVSLDEVLKSKISDDPEIAVVLTELLKTESALKELQQRKGKLENSWLTFGKTRKLAEIESQIMATEQEVSRSQTAIAKILDQRRAQSREIHHEIEELQKEIDQSIIKVEKEIEHKKKERIGSSIKKIENTAASIAADTSRMNRIVKTLNSLDRDWADADLLVWMKTALEVVKVGKEEIDEFEKKQNDIRIQEERYVGMDAQISAAQRNYETALSERYSDDVRKVLRDIQKEVASYSDLGTYQMVFEDAVLPAMEKYGMKSISDRIHRYDLYVQLLFAMKFYGKKTQHIKFMCIDEGQDLALNEYRLICDLNSRDIILNIFGDTNQLIKDHRGIDDWSVLERLLNAEVYTLNENYRNTNQITRFCNDSFDMSMLQTGVDGARVREITKAELESELINLRITTERVAVLLPRGIQKRKYIDLEAISRKAHNTVGEEISAGNVAVMYVDEVKGIEFDKVYVNPGKMGRNERYIAYTRALSELIIVIDESAEA